MGGTIWEPSDRPDRIGVGAHVSVRCGKMRLCLRGPSCFIVLFLTMTRPCRYGLYGPDVCSGFIGRRCNEPSSRPLRTQNLSVRHTPWNNVSATFLSGDNHHCQDTRTWGGVLRFLPAVGMTIVVPPGQRNGRPRGATPWPPSLPYVPPHLEVIR